MKISNTILQLLSLALVGALAFCGGFQLNEMQKVHEFKLEREAVLRLRRMPPVQVAVMELRPRPFRERITLTGMVHPWRSARLAFQEAGSVATLAVDKGDRVEGPGRKGPGRELAAIEKERFAAALDSARAARNQAQWDLEQVQELHRQGSASEQQLRQARLLLDQREAELRLASESFRNTRLLAPFSGTIAERYIELGESVSPQQPAFRLVDQSRVKVVVHVPGRRIAEVKRGQEGEVVVTPERGEPFRLPGRVHHIPTTAKDLLFPVEIEVDNRDRRLREGMIARAVIFTRRLEKVYLLPLETVIQKGKRRLVMLLEKKSLIVDGHFDLGLLPAGLRGPLLRSTGLADEQRWQRLDTDRWDALELAARHRLQAMVTDPGAHRLLGPGVEVCRQGEAARVKELRRSRIAGDRCIVPDDGTFSPGDLLIARGHYQATEGREVRVARRNELGLPEGAGSR